MWLDRYRALLCDLDGCLVAGDRLLPGARELAGLAGERLWILSNNSTDTPQSLSARLAGLGLDAAAERIVLAGATAVEQMAADAPGARLSLYGSEAIRALAHAAGLLLDAGQPDVVLLTRDEGFGYGDLNRIVRQIEGGARLVVANADATHPGADGLPVAETGALLAAVLACRPDIPYSVVGKPSPVLYRAALARIGLDPGAILAIGDNPATDGEGARRMGLDCALIGAAPGAESRDLVDLLASERRIRKPVPLPAP